MRFFLKNLQIFTKTGEVIEKAFSPNITFYHGPTSKGKSTILRIIDFCLGEDLESTAEIQEEFQKAMLNLTIGEWQVTLEREIHHNQIIAEYTKINSTESNSIKIPINTSDEPLIPESQVYNFSDFIFYLNGIKIPFVNRQNIDGELELVRLSFRDFMWYCYLTQDEMTSSLFYLERDTDYNKYRKSRDVLRYILKYQPDKIAEIETKLGRNRHEQASVQLTITQLENFFNERGIADVDTLKKEQDRINNEINNVKEKIQLLRSEITSPKKNILDDLRDRGLKLSIYLQQIQEAIYDYDRRIDEQTRLRSEFITASLKVRRTNVARRVFKDVEFNRCPQCGEPIVKQIGVDTCSLCKQPLDINKTLDAHVPDLDLESRIKELEDSISRLKYEKEHLEKDLGIKIIEKERLDSKLSDESKIYDSNYLAQARELEESKGILEGQIQTIEKILPLSRRIEELKIKHYELSKESEELVSQLRFERSKLQHESENLEMLKTYLKDDLLKVKFPDFDISDEIVIDQYTFFPKFIRKINSITIKTDFNTLGSAGKKNIFKTCYALAIHQLTTRIRSNLPTFIFIDTPMANLSEHEDRKIFNSFYQFLYNLSITELKGHQIIIIDKEFHKPAKSVEGLEIKEERIEKLF